MQAIHLKYITQFVINGQSTKQKFGGAAHYVRDNKIYEVKIYSKR